MAVTITLVVDQPLAGAAPQGIEWGATNNNQAAVESAQGRPFAFLRIYRSIGQDVYGPDLRQQVASGHQLFLSIGPWDSANAPIKLSAIVNGSYDTYFATQFDKLNAIPATTYFAFDHEPTSAAHTRSCDDPSNCAAQFVAAWQHLHALAVSRGDTKFLWAWTMMSTFFRLNNDATATTWFPGASNVDRVGLDAYPANCDGTAANGTAQTLVSLTAVGRTWASTHVPAMPVIVPEWGAPSSSDAVRAAWFQRTYDDAKAGKLGQVTAMSYFNNSKGTRCAWALDTKAPSFSVFAKMATDPFFGATSA
ncbi:MAG: hypothetical protein JO087_07495 [Actinobacteria bacterium]|nr:hypothetical protein [Actinomycetota bacterium]